MNRRARIKIKAALDKGESVILFETMNVISERNVEEALAKEPLNKDAAKIARFLFGHSRDPAAAAMEVIVCEGNEVALGQLLQETPLNIPVITTTFLYTNLTRVQTLLQASGRAVSIVCVTQRAQKVFDGYTQRFSACTEIQAGTLQ